MDVIDDLATGQPTIESRPERQEGVDINNGVFIDAAVTQQFTEKHCLAGEVGKESQNPVCRSVVPVAGDGDIAKGKDSIPGAAEIEFCPNIT